MRNIIGKIKRTIIKRIVLIILFLFKGKVVNSNYYDAMGCVEYHNKVTLRKYRFEQEWAYGIEHYTIENINKKGKF